MSRPIESAFEDHIADWLTTSGGYTGAKRGGTDFDPHRGFDVVELFGFVESTQPDEWAKVVKTHSDDAEAAQKAFMDRLGKELDTRGTVDVLRHGVVYAGHEKAELRLAYFRPASGLNPDLEARFAANRLTVTRQLPYEAGSNRTLDVCLFVNGLPVATAELKNPITGQTVDHAREQYRKNRDADNVTLRRALVHFAVDTEQVSMSTRLAGEDTVFLPFNQGSGDGPGNPANPDGHRTAYLWERVWSRDGWMDLLGRFVHVEKPAPGTRGQGIVIFPRFHQWDAVLRLEQAARSEGPGGSYLVQHSAGSGKSNTIAWLAYRLSSLHDTNDAKVFDKVVVVTDRVVLDRQLQDTIYQFEHAHGVVEKIDTDSAHLARALAGEQARIVITTIFKFPFVMDHIESLPGRSYAVIVDEAHSSQTGDAAKEMKKVLGTPAGGSEEALAFAEEAESAGAGEVSDPVEDLLAVEVAARGRQANMSFFAFTATPKGRTLELFGRINPATGKHEAFHLYSMRQAISERFIHDVLANYVTYQMYWRIEKAIANDPQYETRAARAAIAKYVSLHDHNLSQKADIIINHFRTHVADKIGGQAKAMVVTASRLHALRYRDALVKYCDQHGIDDVGVLVAFSGTLEGDLTESRANGFPESQTPARFDSDEFQILVVAEKYQTGFDQPKLYAMYVDKVLTGLGAVQTLSRLNRTHPLKKETFVLDFRNEADHIREAFAPWYVQTVAPPTDPHHLYDTRADLDSYGILRSEEVGTVVALVLADARKNHARIHAALAPALDRYAALSEEEQDESKDKLTRFIRMYSFLSQVVSFTDTKLERDYLYCRSLAPFLRGERTAGVDLGSQIELTHVALEKTHEGDVGLTADVDGEVVTIFSGTGPSRVVEQEPLSEIVRRMNERYGTAFTEAQAAHISSVIDTVVNDPDTQQVAWANSEKAFGEMYAQMFQGAMLDLQKANEEFTFTLLDDPELLAHLLTKTRGAAYAAARVAAQQFAPGGELLAAGETAYLEYKSTLRTRTDTGEVFRPLETSVLKTIAAFLNSPHGGTLLIGVADDGSVHGLDTDYTSLRKEGHDDSDRFQLHLTNLIISSMGAPAAARVITDIHGNGGKHLCRVHVNPSPVPVEAEVTETDEKGQHSKATVFYARLNNQTRELTGDEKTAYIAQRWPH